MRSAYAETRGSVPAMNTTRALARIILAADRAGLPESVVAELWSIRQLTDAGQRDAIRRWHNCMRTWPAA